MKKVVNLELDYKRENGIAPAAKTALMPVSRSAETRRIAGLNLEQIHSHEIKLPDPEFTFQTQSKSMISLGFMIKGYGSSRYQQVQDSMQLSPMSFNVMFQAGLSAEHTMWGKNGFHFIHLGIGNEKFLNLLSASPELQEQYAKIIATERFFLYHGSRSPQMQPALIEALNNFRQIDFTNSLCGLLLESSLLSLIAHTHSQSFKEEAICKTEKQMRDLKHFLDIHFLETITLKELAREFGLNEYLIKNSFRKYYQTSVFNYLQQLRMTHAQELLLAGMSVKATALTIGYEHPHHFSKAFSKWFGYNPSRLKQQIPESGF